jgi:hypothetical protein
MHFFNLIRYLLCRLEFTGFLWRNWVVLSLLTLGFASSSHVRSADAIDWQEADHFWSIQAPLATTRPRVKLESWPRQTIDFHVLSTMEAQGLHPAHEASRSTLLRRLYYDLTGLPPTFEEMQGFIHDTAPDAYEQRVDRLLESPRFGERMASMWLNLARYAEDQAHQVGSDTKHFYPNAYHYRRWVIDAFNRDLAYPDFIKLQLAGDLYEDTSHDDLVATGFIGLGPKYYNRGRLDVKAEEWADQVDTVMRTFQGLTVGCARCHDHKFDPITMEDYYGVAGVFASTDLVNVAYDKPADQVTEEDMKAHRFTAHIVKDGKAEDLHVFQRGNVDQKGEVVPRRFISWLSQGDPEAFDTRESGRRELAEEIASPENPLTARVYVNRIWALYFGKGLVPTLSNFGALGEKPSHPGLLDDLAVRFLHQGGSTKRLVREIVLSATYRQDSVAEKDTVHLDPDNRWLTRMSRRRMGVEMWRDSLLAVAGTLQQKGGASLELDDPNNVRRTVYARISRLKLNDLLIQMDYPDANVHAASRSSTTTPLQKLFAMNSPFMMNQSDALLKRLDLQQSKQDLILQLYQEVFARSPDDSERALAGAFLTASPDGAADEKRLGMLAQALMISNEMLYLD